MLALLVIAGLGGVGLGGYFAACQAWAEHHYRAARAALERRDFSEARAHLLLCLQARPGSGRAHLLAARAARRADACADAERLLTAYEQACGPTPASRLEWALLGAQQGDFAGEEERLRAEVAAQHQQQQR
jgi:hypothetical protein